MDTVLAADDAARATLSSDAHGGVSDSPESTASLAWPEAGGLPVAPRLHAGASSAWDESIDTFLVDVARHGDACGAASHVELGAGAVVAQRYRLVEPLGRGAHGTVWAASDTVSGARVAVKLIVVGSPQQSARVRAEVVSLRTARSSGAVRLLDEGVEQGVVFIVMPIIEGAPFPGRKSPATWDLIEPIALQLMEAQRRFHAMGIVHRDLKPANVLVDARGCVTVLDFGVSLPPLALETRESIQILGTPAYLAPEQIDVGPVDARADIYAAGVMLFEALTGRLPHDERGVRAMLMAKRTPVTPLRALAPSVPEDVAATIDAMLSCCPAGRPASASDAIQGLRGVPRAPRGLLASSERWPPKLGKRALSVRGVTRLLLESGNARFVAEDAAALLHERTGGEPDRLREEVETWMTEGTCRYDAASGALTLDRPALDRRRARHARASQDVCDVDALLVLARDQARRGATGLSGALLLVALGEQGLDGSSLRGESIERVLSLAVEVALVDGAPDLIDAVLYELCRIGPRSPSLARLESLVRAALSVGPWTDRALVLASNLPRFHEVELELLRQSVRVLAARKTSVEQEEAVLDEIGAWARSHVNAAVAGTYAGWLGRLRYRQARYAEAALLHVRAARSPIWATLRARAQMNAASAFMEAFDLSAASQWAAAAHRAYLRCRHADGCVETAWFQRLVSYRCGAPLLPEPDQAERIAEIGRRELEGLASITEAAIAWRCDRRDVALALARRALDTWRTLGEKAGGMLLSRALLAACAAPGALPESEVDDVVAEASACPTPGVGIQVLGLVARHRRSPRDPEVERLLASQIPRRHWAQRIDLLSVDEARDLLDAVGAARPGLLDNP